MKPTPLTLDEIARRQHRHEHLCRVLGAPVGLSAERSEPDELWLAALQPHDEERYDHRRLLASCG